MITRSTGSCFLDFILLRKIESGFLRSSLMLTSSFLIVELATVQSNFVIATKNRLHRRIATDWTSKTISKEDF